MNKYPHSLFAALAGLLLLTSAAALAQQSASTQPGSHTSEQFTLSLKDANISTLIATVSEITGRNFVVDPRVKGKVTVLSAHPMSAKDLYQAFLSVLAVHGFSAVPAGSVTKIVPQVNAKQDGGFGQGTHTNENIVTRVIHVNNVPAAQLVPILRPLVPQYGHLAAYPASNILIISDRASNVKRIARIVSKVDKKGNNKIERIPLKNANASEVVRLIKQLETSGSKRSKRSTSYTAVADDRTNSVLISGDNATRMKLRAIIANLDTPSKQQGGTHVFYLNYADAEDMVKVLKSFVQEQTGDEKGTSGKGKASIVADKGANALVINAQPEIMRNIRSVIDKLDIRRGQVLVQGLIAEISLDKSRELGVDIGAFNPNGGAIASVLDSDTLSALPALLGGGSGGGAGAGAGAAGLVKQGLTLGGGIIHKTGTSFAALIKAMAGNSNTNVLSTPSIITRDNEEAKITVAQEVPFITGSYTSSTSAGGTTTGIANPFETVQRKNVGLILTITPQINAGDTIQMDLKLEVSSIAPNSEGAVDLVTNKRTIDTSVAVKDGQVLVLGGLIDTKINETQRKVPLLGDIPLLGALFRYQKAKKSKRNLLNFIRPVILRGHGAANYYTRKKYNHMRDLQKQQRKQPIPLLPGENRPLAPSLESYGEHPDFSRDAKLHPDSGNKHSTTGGSGQSSDQHAAGK